MAIKRKKIKRPTWCEYFMVMAKLAASRSTCLSRPNGSVIVKDKRVIATGYNGSMPGVAHCSDDGVCFRRSIKATDAGKYDFCRSIHSEANAIAQAAKMGISVEGATLYNTLAPCYVCTKLLVSAGIKEVFYEYEYKSINKKRDKLWKEAVVESCIKIKQLHLKPKTIKFIIPFIEKITAERRLESQ